MSKILEICIDNIESFLNSIDGGANRIELCSSLSEGGLTPTPGLLKAIQQLNEKKIPIFCMIRCRAGFDFNYTNEEMNAMVEDVNILKQHGADGFVFGALNDQRDVDLKKCHAIIKAAYPLPVTFHRAFDVCRKPLTALESIIDIGFKRILTSGQKSNAFEGADNIKSYHKAANGRIIIIAGCGINKDNLSEILNITEVNEVHGSASEIKEIEIFDQLKHLDNTVLKVTSAKIVQQLISILKN